jgi:dephospho-CoA kinase
MTEKKIWCVAGLPGSGKTNLSKKLSTPNGIETFSRDEIYKELYTTHEINLVLEYSRAIEGHTTNNIDDQKHHELIANIIKCVPGLRELVTEVIPFLDISGYIEQPEVAKKCFEEIDAYKDDLNFFIHLISNNQIHLLLAIIAAKRTFERATSSDCEIVLIEDPYFTLREVRDMTQGFLKDLGFDPGLIVIQSEVDLLVSRAEVRSKIDHLVRRPSSEEIKYDINRATPYSPGEETWSDVIVLDSELTEEIEAIRSRLSGTDNPSPDAPVPFVRQI